MYPDPPKVSMDAAIARWKITNATVDNQDPKPTVQQYDTIRDGWRSKDKVNKFLGMFSSQRFQKDWLAAQPTEALRENATWTLFLQYMRAFYKPTEQPTLKNYQFRDVYQGPAESFTAYCSRVALEAGHCSFKCVHADCTAEETATRDQIVIGTRYQNIREEALLKSWNLPTLRTEGMKMESAMKGGTEIGGEDVNRLGKYSHKNNKIRPPASTTKQKPRNNACYRCGEKYTNFRQHQSICKGLHNTCSNCSKPGHLPHVCRSKPAVKQVETEVPDVNVEVEDEDTYNINIFVLNSSRRSPKPKLRSMMRKKHDFSVQVVINSSLDRVLADTGAKVSVCGTVQAKKWGILNRLVPSTKKIHPYKSDPIPVHGTARCAVSFGSRIIPVEWHIISGSCEPILSGIASRQLGIIKFNETPDTFEPIHIISEDADAPFKDNLQQTMVEFPENFTGFKKLKDHQVKLHVDSSVKPKVTPERPTPYHLTERVDELVNKMLSNDIIEEVDPSEPIPWISAATIAPKTNGDIRMTLDARNVNKALQASNLPIPRQEDIRAKLGGKQFFSKLDFKHAFWQLELHPDSRYLTVFSCNGKLYRYKRLTMGLKPAQGELNAALLPLFAHIPGVFLIHDDIIIATNTQEEHKTAFREVMKVVSETQLTLNPDKCIIGATEIHFWGLLISRDGVRPDPAKVSALDHITPPTNRQELISFLCMMQANSEFIPNFARKSAPLRELTHANRRFVWTNEHSDCYNYLLDEFRTAALLRFFDPNQRTFIIVDAHITGLGATLSQGEDLKSSRPVAFASRATKPHEKHYPQLDLEATAINYGLTRFRHYLVGSPEVIVVITDHKPLCSIFNGTRHGSIRTDRMKLLHQDIPYRVEYRKGTTNLSDYLSRRATPLHMLSVEEQHEPDELNNLLYMIHTTPYMDSIGLGTISQHTSNDNVLSALRGIINAGKTWIPKDADPALQKFSSILPSITVTGNGILLKEERIILPQSLQQQAIKLAHRGSHPGEIGLQQRLRYHFFFHDMNKQVKDFVSSCPDCQSFTDKKTSEPLAPHSVPQKNWSKVAVDLFGPMPSRNHIVVVQDLASRFPAAKLVKSTKASSVIPAMTDIYNNFGNPETQLSDNGPPFNSEAMNIFCKSRNINIEKIPPLHPSANPAETFMKSVGKTMKIATQDRVSEKDALSQLLSNYRDTPHPATGVTPNDMMFRDPPQSSFPRREITQQQIDNARTRDAELKDIRQQKINASKYRQESVFRVGDTVLIRNFNKTSKYDPLFQRSPLVVKEVQNNGRCLILQRLSDGKVYQRHPDDVKMYNGPRLPSPVQQQALGDEQCAEYLQGRMWDLYNDESDYEMTFATPLPPPPGFPPLPQQNQRPVRQRLPNPRYYNDNLVNSLAS